jgi:hypothetical protein
VVFEVLKRGKDLPDEHHVMRRVSWSKLRKDEDENVIGFLPQAFELRPDEAYLSVNWLEYFDGDHEQRIKQTVNAFRKKFAVGKKTVFGIAKVGKVKGICRANGTTVRIVYSPTTDHPSHAAVNNFPRDDLALLEAMAADAFVESVRSADVIDSNLADSAGAQGSN